MLLGSYRRQGWKRILKMMLQKAEKLEESSKEVAKVPTWVENYEIFAAFVALQFIKGTQWRQNVPLESHQCVKRPIE